jgi:hypothetical protein
MIPISRKNTGFILSVFLVTVFFYAFYKSDPNGKRAATKKMYQTAAFRVGDKVTVEASGQPGNVLKVFCDWQREYCKYHVNAFDGARHYKILLYEFELEKRQ